MISRGSKKGAYRVILGIDPGTNQTGYGVLEVSGESLRCIVLGEIELSKLKDPYQKLSALFNRVSELVEQYKPDEVALESPFFGENVQSMLKLGRAQGVAMAAALARGIAVSEYAPRRIKQSITGNGAASKEQVAMLLKSMLGIEYSIKKLDATDGLAVAVCHHFESQSPINKLVKNERSKALGGGLKALSKGGSSSWESYLSKNPEREIANKAPQKRVAKRIVKSKPKLKPGDLKE